MFPLAAYELSGSTKGPSLCRKRPRIAPDAVMQIGPNSAGRQSEEMRWLHHGRCGTFLDV